MGVSIALRPAVLTTLYFIGPELSEKVVGTPEIHHLFELMSIRGHLLNDIQSFKVREAEKGIEITSFASYMVSFVVSNLSRYVAEGI